MVFPQQRGVGFSREERREVEGGGWRGETVADTPQTPTGPGEGGSADSPALHGSAGAVVESGLP